MLEKDMKSLLLGIQSELEMKVRRVRGTRHEKKDEHFHSNITVLSNTIE